jgi:hypothetical protein
MLVYWMYCTNLIFIEYTDSNVLEYIEYSYEIVINGS